MTGTPSYTTKSTEPWQDLARKRLDEVRSEQKAKRKLRDDLTKQARGLTQELAALTAEEATLERALRPPRVRQTSSATETTATPQDATSGNGEGEA